MVGPDQKIGEAVAVDVPREGHGLAEVLSCSIGLDHPIGEHLITQFAVLPELQPLGGDLHRLLEGGFAEGLTHGAMRL